MQCGLCLRTSELANPCPNRHKGDTLRFANKTECMGCRNYCNGPLSHKTKADIKEGLKKQGNRESYVKCVENFEAKFDANESRRMTADDGELVVPAWLNVEDTIERGWKKQVCVFWPRSVLVREGVVFEEKDLVEWEGDDEKGLFRDCKFGSPSGTSAIYERRSKKLKTGKELANTMAGASAQEVSDKFAAAHGRLGKLKLGAPSEASGSMSVTVEARGHYGLDWDDMLPSFGVEEEKVEKPPEEEKHTPPAGSKRRKTGAKSKAKCV